MCLTNPKINEQPPSPLPKYVSGKMKIAISPEIYVELGGRRVHSKRQDGKFWPAGCLPEAENSFKPRGNIFVSCHKHLRG